MKLDYLQFETVRNLFNHSGWDFEGCDVGPNTSFETNATNENLKKMQSVNHEMSQRVAAMMDLVMMMACGAAFGSGKERLYKWYRSHDQDGRHAYIW